MSVRRDKEQLRYPTHPYGTRLRTNGIQRHARTQRHATMYQNVTLLHCIHGGYLGPAHHNLVQDVAVCIHDSNDKLVGRQGAGLQCQEREGGRTKHRGKSIGGSRQPHHTHVHTTDTDAHAQPPSTHCTKLLAWGMGGGGCTPKHQRSHRHPPQSRTVPPGPPNQWQCLDPPRCKTACPELGNTQTPHTRGGIDEAKGLSCPMCVEKRRLWVCCR